MALGAVWCACLSKFLFGVKATGPSTFFAIAIILTAVAIHTGAPGNASRPDPP